MIKAYFVEFEKKEAGSVRYLCDSHAEDIIRLKKKCGIKFFTEIHSDVYDKKCHLCKKWKEKK